MRGPDLSLRFDDASISLQTGFAMASCTHSLIGGELAETPAIACRSPRGPAFRGLRSNVHHGFHQPAGSHSRRYVQARQILVSISDVCYVRYAVVDLQHSIHERWDYSLPAVQRPSLSRFYGPEPDGHAFRGSPTGMC